MMDWHKQEHRKWGTGRNDEGKGVGAGSISSISLPVLHCGKKREKPIFFFFFSACQVESFCILHGLIPTDLQWQAEFDKGLAGQLAVRSQNIAKMSECCIDYANRLPVLQV